MLQRLLALARKEFIQIRRDRRTLAMMFAIPLLWLILFGYAFSFDVQELTVAVVDQSGTRIGGMVAEAFSTYDRFNPAGLADKSEAGIREAIRRDDLQMGIIIPPGYGDDAAVQLQVLADGADLFAAQTGARLLTTALQPVIEQVKAEVTAKTQADVKQRLAQFLQSTGAALPPGFALDLPAPAQPQLIPNVEILYNPDLKSAVVMIPGLLGMVVMFMTTLMTAMGVVREREHGTMEQLVVTPIRPLELIVGKLVPYFVVAAVDFALVYIAGVYLFDLHFAGNLPIFLLLSLLLVFTTLALGLLLSTVAQNQQQAMQMAVFTVVPQMLLSGLIFPLASLPKAIQYVAYLFPFTYYVPIARGMFIKGQELSLLSREAAILAAYAAVMVILATLRFRKRVA